MTLVKEAYNRWASSYDTDINRTRDLDASITRAVLGDRLVKRTLEIGCGTGKNTGFYARVSGQVLAADYSVNMLRGAREKVGAANVRFCIADLTQPWPWADRFVDRIACNLVLEHIADLSFIFAEARRVLAPGGTLFISELHPFRQYQGTQANFQRGEEQIKIPAYVHHISDFLQAAANAGFTMQALQEWWGPADEEKPPRLVSFVFG